MATLVITAVGAVFGRGPIASLAGAVFGFAAQSLFGGGGRSVQGPRLSDLSVQSSAYGTPLARLYGTIRASGSVIWATDIGETAHRSGGGKGKPKTTTYSYSASFAVALSGRPIRAIRRIWGDGKLMRSASGQWIIPAKMRLYKGEGDEAADPLIVSAEGLSATPAYRGMAYVVFEDLDLSEFANHIPSLSFEVEADAGPVGAETVIDDLAGATGFAPVLAGGAATRMRGFGIASGGPVRSVFETLAKIDPLFLRDDGERIALSLEAEPAPIEIAGLDLGAVAANSRAERAERKSVRRGASGVTPAEVSIGYFDIDRDYQTGLQRSHFGHGTGVERIELPAALVSGEAKALARRKMIELAARKVTATLRLPYRAITLRPGDVVRAGGDGALWRVREITIERMVAELGLERVAQLPLAIASDADGGRVAVQNGVPNGETLLEVMDLPPLFDELPGSPRVWIGASGRTAGWRRADVSLSLDGGANWQALTTATGGSVTGKTLGALAPAGALLWDDLNTLDVELTHDGMWIEGRSDEALLAGGNLALVGDELIQFGRAEAIGPRRFRIGRLLRGRRGTEWAAAAHAPGGRFVMIDPALAGAFDLPVSRIGSTVLFMAVGPGEDPGAAEPVSLLLRGASLLPPAPVHLQAERLSNGDIAIRWIRRSRQGWGWIDGVDAPLGEESEAYRLIVQPLGGSERIAQTASPAFVYALSDQIFDGGDATRLNIAVAQLSATAGAGRVAGINVTLDG